MVQDVHSYHSYSFYSYYLFIHIIQFVKIGLKFWEWIRKTKGKIRLKCFCDISQDCCYCSVVKLCPTLCNPMNCSKNARLLCPLHSLRVCSNSSIELVMLFNHLIICCPLLLPSIFLSIRVFCNELALHIRWPKYWSFSFSISPSSEYSGLISFRNDWFDLPAVQRRLKSLLQHHNLKASILQNSVFLVV